ncbi:hypothetical protein PENTCL1PPCAC_7325, partial [Pristionchus entomophagus]
SPDKDAALTEEGKKDKMIQRYLGEVVRLRDLLQTEAMGREASEEKTRELEDRLDLQKKKIEKGKTKLSDAKEQFEEEKEEMKKMWKVILREKDEEMKKMREEMEGQKRKFSREKKAHELEVGELKEANRKLKSRVNTLEDKMKKEKEENEELKISTSKKLSVQVHESKRLNGVNKELLAKLKMRESEKEELKDEVKRLLNEVDTLNRDNFSLSSKLAEAERAVDAARKEKEEGMRGTKKTEQTASAAVRNTMEGQSIPLPFAVISPTINAALSAETINMRAEYDHLRQARDYWKREHDRIHQDFAKYRKTHRHEKSRPADRACIPIASDHGWNDT